MKQHSSFLSILLFTVFCLTVQCSKKQAGKEEITAIQKNQNIKTEEAIAQFIPMILQDQLKEWKMILNPTDKRWSVLVSYGGSTALTFDSQEEYKKNTFLVQALVLSRLSFALAPYEVGEITLSLSKPLYVKNEKNPDVGIQEFEILRTTLPFAKAVAVLKKYSHIDPYANQKSQKEDLLKMLNEITEVWVMNLDELDKITVE
ncbi:hypothetical protein [Leptospira idonii]|uniref:Uncharacterized protein n=1 Tax=Leptospira idonii TaxID=1193500 RepID=A0A4R9LTU9_9LEPT|nr:hypothetical protein [Leptospira idonii]TGN17165.1 hypothetical protein EHS15_18505 [Leptospira idonii]